MLSKHNVSIGWTKADTVNCISKNFVQTYFESDRVYSVYDELYFNLNRFEHNVD